MAKLIKELSVFLPTYNEEGGIEKVIGGIKRVLEKVAAKWEIIIVEDGSKDGTPRITDELTRRTKNIKVIHHETNRGYGGALKTGFNNAKYEWIAFVDSDGQFDFGEITKFIEKKDSADLVLGYRKNRADSLARKIFTFGWGFLAKIILGLTAKDYSCGFKMIKKSVYKKLLPLVGEEKVTQIEMLVKAKRMGFKIEEVGVNHFPRISGAPTGAKFKVVAKSLADLFKLWWKMTDRKEFLYLFSILSAGAFFRLYKISAYMTYLGDEGRDMIIVRRFLTEIHPPLIGPGTSIGNMYLGPLYYYMMAPSVLLANFSPVGPAVMVALLGVATIALVYWVGREWFGKTAGKIAAFFYAISPTVIIYSKSSWNPNIMPFFALASVYAIWKVWEKKEFNWLIVLGVLYAFVLQSHYLGLLLLPVILVFWYLSRAPMRHTLYATAIFALLMSPLLLFDLRHNFQNFNSVKEFSLKSGGSFTGPIAGIRNFIPTFLKISERLPGGRNKIAGVLVGASLVLGSAWFIKRKKFNWVLAAWILVGAFGLATYKNEVFDHYMGFLFPSLFIFLGWIFQEALKIKNKPLKVVFVFSLLLLALINLKNSPLLYPPNRQLQRSKEIASFIKDKAKGERFNLATLSERNNRDVYQYFLLVWGAKVVDTDPNAVAFTVTDQLFVVCERPKEKCDPTHDPSAWVTNFGWSKILDSWEVSGTNIYKLGHAK